jgi:membrane fusion protein, multidrug efflux system
MKKKNNGKTRKIIVSIIISVIVVTVIVFRLISNKKSFDSELEMVKNFNTVIPVNIDTVKNISFSDGFSVNGSFYPMHEVSIVSETQGKVTSINVEPGSKVAINQILAVTENKVSESQLGLAKANYEKAKKDLERFEKLNKDDAVSVQQYEAALLAYENAKTAFASAVKQFNDSMIKSPIAGIITKRNIEMGTYLSPGVQAFEVIEINKLKFIAKVTDEEVMKIKAGQIVKISAEIYPGILYEGKINSILVKSDQSKRYNVEIEVNNSADNLIRPGMFGSVIIPSDTKKSLVIPRKALTGTIKSPEVFVVKDDSVILKSIVAEPLNEKHLIVREGLEAGNIIVVSGQINLKNGSKIKIQ